MKRLAILSLASLLALGPPGCAPTTRVIRQEQRQATIKITSDQPGHLLINKVLRGETPARVKVPYSIVDKEVIPGTRKQGWWLLGTGLLGLGAGIGMTAWGFSSVGDTDLEMDAGERVAQTVTGSLGIPVGLYGLFGMIAGVYYVATAKNRRIVEVSPRVLEVGIKLPGSPLQKARVSSTVSPLELPPYEQLKALHFSLDRGWVAPDLPPGLQLKPSPGQLPRPRAPAPGPAEAAAPLAGLDNPDISPAKLALIEKLRKEGADCYRKRRYPCALARFERAFALAPSPAMRFNLASALDKLNRPAQAARQYRRYLEDSGRHTSPSALAHIQARMKALLPLVGRLQLTIRPEDARVTLDGVSLEALGATTRGAKTEVILRPETYRLEVSLPGRRTRTEEVILGKGQLRALEIVLQPTPAVNP